MAKMISARGRIAGIAGRSSSVLPQAVDEQTTPTWVVDGIINTRVRSGRRELFRQAMREAEKDQAKAAARKATSALTGPRQDVRGAAQPEAGSSASSRQSKG